MKQASKQIPGGLVIMFDGIDGVGKTTQLQQAQTALTRVGWEVHTTRNLGGTPIGEALRQVVLSPLERSAETDMYISLAIQAALVKAVETERQAGKIILVDRGPLSLAAYHIYGNGFSEDKGWQYAEEGLQQFRPDLLIVYDAPVEVALARAKENGKADYYESKPLAYFKRVAAGFDKAREHHPLKIIDATQPIKAVHTQTLALIQAAIDQKGAIVKN